MQPGSHWTFHVHGEHQITVKEVGDFLSNYERALVSPYIEAVVT